MKRKGLRMIMCGLASCATLTGNYAQVPDLYSLACPDDIRGQGCLGGHVAWISEGKAMDGTTTTWHSSEHMRMRRTATPDSLTWEYMRYCDPWPARANVLDTLRIIRLASGRLKEVHAVPYRTTDWNVAGVRTTTRPLLVEDTMLIAARSLPRKARSGCMAVYKSHTFVVLLLRTADEGAVHRYAWTPETGLLFMIVPDRPAEDEVQLVVRQQGSEARFMRVHMAGKGRDVLIAALTEQVRAVPR